MYLPVAPGFVLIWLSKASGVFNFAQGAMVVPFAALDLSWACSRTTCGSTLARVLLAPSAR